MKKQKRKTVYGDLEHFKALQPYVDKMAIGSLGKHHQYSLCVKASLAKCFEFNLAIRKSIASTDTFFAMASLRGICEDVIVLGYMKKMPAVDREKLILALMAYETSARIKLQDEFFTAIRPQQPVLRIANVDARIAASEAAAMEVWNRHGWPN
jgi:hypothetical protein